MRKMMREESEAKKKVPQNRFTCSNKNQGCLMCQDAGEQRERERARKTPNQIFFFSLLEIVIGCGVQNAPTVH